MAGRETDRQRAQESLISLANKAKNKFNNVLLSFCFKAVC